MPPIKVESHDSAGGSGTPRFFVLFSRTVAMAALAVLTALPVSVQAQTVISTKDGKVRGEDADETSSFKGIPFAKAPVGDLRWRAPEPPKRWSGVRDATQFGASCVQPPRPGGPDIAVSEDCLFLNLWRPKGTAASAKLPVMVWIHGGAFVTGSPAWPVYSGAPLAKNNVILITVNYRLGYLGWFAHPDLTRESAGRGTGNYGLLDQVAALAWIKRNIAAFGGDPSNVTIFGESAGGLSVTGLMVAPQAHGLFAKAVSQSSPAFPMRDLASAEAIGTKVATRLGASDLAALRAVPAEKVIAAATAAGGGDPASSPSMIVDGAILQDTPDRLFKAGRAVSVPWIIGTVDAEMAMFPDQRQGYLEKLPAPLMTKVMAAYDPEGRKDKEQLAIEVTGDVFWAGPARTAAALHAARNKTYRYVFGYVPEAARDRLTAARHGSDIPFTLGTLGARAVGDIAGGGRLIPYSAADWHVSRDFGLYLTNFARTGDPNGPGLAPWNADKPDTALLIDASGFRSMPAYRKRELDVAAELPTGSKR